MAFHNKKNPSAIISDIMNYQQYLKSDDALKHYQTPDGFYLNITKIEQTPAEKIMSEKMENFYNDYRDIINENKDE